MPVHDWQFWVVTLVAGVALALIVRAGWPGRRARRARARRVVLTISGRPADPPAQGPSDAPPSG